MKQTKDYDSVFKTLKSKHKRLFISVINDTFGKDYPLDSNVDILSAESYLTENETTKGDKELEEKITDFLICLGNEVNKTEERLVNVMGGVVLETESERLIRIGKTEGIAIGEKNGIAIGEKNGIAIGEKNGIAIGEKNGIEKGIRSLVETCQKFGISINDATEQLMEQFDLTKNDAIDKVKSYWKANG